MGEHNKLFQCPCVPGFREIPGVKDCVDDDECARGNFTCNDFSHCKNTVRSRAFGPILVIAKLILRLP